jgi:DNA repair ATPase RecN
MRNRLFCNCLHHKQHGTSCARRALLVYRELRHTICRRFNNAATLHEPAQHRACELRRRTITLKKLQANTPSKLLHKASQVPKHMVAELSTLNIAMHTQQAEQKSTSLHTQAQTLDTTTHAASALPGCSPPQYPGKRNCHPGAP